MDSTHQKNSQIKNKSQTTLFIDVETNLGISAIEAGCQPEIIQIAIVS